MDKKNLFLVSITAVFLAGLVSFAFLIGCGSSGSSPSTGYTLSGKVGTVSATGLSASALATDTVTHIVAIASDGTQTIITPEASGIFSVSVTAGQPYVLGFYNKTGSTITLLGYLQNSDYDWDSLPIIDPTGTSTDLGTIEIATSSVEATPSINISSLISAMNMTSSVASLYGEIDNPLSALSNVDTDGNGEFDSLENKKYLFQSFVNMNQSGVTATGEITAMMSGYNDTYKPVPGAYQIYFSSVGNGDTKTLGTSATLTPPSALGGSTTQTATTGVTGGGDGWTLFFPAVTTPSIAPAGTYTVLISPTIYTIKNFKASDVVSIEANNNIVYPVFHLVTNESGVITTVQYKWQKLVNGTIANATDAEVLAAINYIANSTSSLVQNPFISFFSGASSLISGTSLITLPVGGTEVNISAYNIKRTDIHHIQAGYELNSKVICKFDLY